MQDHTITVQLRLPGLAVWGVVERDDAIEVVAEQGAEVGSRSVRRRDGEQQVERPQVHSRSRC